MSFRGLRVVAVVRESQLLVRAVLWHEKAWHLVAMLGNLSSSISLFGKIEVKPILQKCEEHS